jgi:hypothetical protein
MTRGMLIDPESEVARAVPLVAPLRKFPDEPVDQNASVV